MGIALPDLSGPNLEPSAVPVLELDGERLDSWTRASLRKSLDEFAHSWSVEYTDKWAPKGDPWTILPGARTQFLIGDFGVAITGYVTRASWRASATDYRVSAEGRSVTADLVDCAPFADLGTSDQVKKLTPFKIITKICEPFHISVIDETKDPRVISKFNIELGETAFDAIDRVCRLQGILPVTRADGSLVLTDSGFFTREVTMAAHTVVDRGMEFSEEELFSTYFVYGQHPAEENFKAKKVASQAGKAVDETVSRYRPGVILADAPAAKAHLEAQALWERNVRQGRAKILRYRVPGVLAPDGLPWEPGMLVKVDDDVMRVNATLLVRSVSQSWGPDGQWTDLELCRPEAYTREPETPKKLSKNA